MYTCAIYIYIYVYDMYIYIYVDICVGGRIILGAGQVKKFPLPTPIKGYLLPKFMAQSPPVRASKQGTVKKAKQPLNRDSM